LLNLGVLDGEDGSAVADLCISPAAHIEAGPDISSPRRGEHEEENDAASATEEEKARRETKERVWGPPRHVEPTAMSSKAVVKTTQGCSGLHR
jgi:hypothetical protein